MRTALLFCMLALSVSCAASDGVRLTKDELTELLGPDTRTTLQWSRTEGPDFTVFFGKAAPPLSGGIGFYLGDHPTLDPVKGSLAYRGRLGTFDVVWHRKTREDGWLYQTALLKLPAGSEYSAIHVWVFGSRESDVNALIRQLAAIPRFNPRVSTKTQ